MYRLTLIILVGLWTSLSYSPARADNAMLADLAGRLEYAFYTQDVRELQQAVTELSKPGDGAPTPEQLSWLNYGRWKLAQLQVTTQAEQAGQVAEQCANEVWPDKLPINIKAVALALQAACNDLLAEMRPVRRVLYRHDRDKQHAQALKLGGDVAQVMLVSSWLSLRVDDAKTAYPRLQKGVMLYDVQERIGQQRIDNWGQAELSYLLGKVDIQRNDVLAARNDLERALVIAADYRDAAVLLKTLRVK